MFKIKGYLKKFWYLILACICLLFVQAQTELTLPDYMSDIVSVGIQAGGFASPVSDVLTEETYQHLLLFVDQKDQKTVKKDYKKVITLTKFLCIYPFVIIETEGKEQ